LLALMEEGLLAAPSAPDWISECHIRALPDRRRSDELELKRVRPGWRARRWVVEACHSGLNRNRALLIRWSKKAENHLALLQLACGLIALKKARGARLAHALPG
jgi:hypothetical protein